MRISGLLLLISIILAGCTADTKKEQKETGTTPETAVIKLRARPFVLNGNVAGLKTGHVVLKKKQEGAFLTIDSTQIDNGSFALKGNIKIPEVYAILISDNKQYLGKMSFFLDAGEMMVNTDVENIEGGTIQGSDTEAKYQAFKKRLKVWDDKTNAAYDEYKKVEKKGDIQARNRINKELDAIYEEKTAFINRHVMGNLEDALTPFLAMRYLSTGASLNSFGKIANGLSPALGESKYTKEVKQFYEVLKSVSVGKPAVELKLKNPEGKMVKLSDTKGKFVLLDFWASWCAPCRDENPNILKAYNKYKDKGFTVFSVSLDSNKKKWEKAIAEDKLSWTMVQN